MRSESLRLIRFSFFTLAVFQCCTFMSYSQQSSCTNSDFELGTFANWTGEIGSCCPIATAPSGIVAGRHTIMTGPGIDIHSNGQIPVVCPGGNFSARLGNDDVNAEAERLYYSFPVTAQTDLFIYRYAVILEDPAHTILEQPRFQIRVFDQSGAAVGCGTYDVVSGTGIPGFQSWLDPSTGDSVHFKTWTTVGVDLSTLSGQTVTIEFSTGDCSLGAHFGYAYLDAFCSPLTIINNFCPGQSSTVLTAPVGFSNYSWNTGQNTQSITINNPVAGTQYICTLTSVTGCTVSVSTILAPIQILPNFTTLSMCDNTIGFVDSTSVLTGGNILSWEWSFGDGTFSTLQNPTHVYQNPGPVNVTLVVTNSNGCKDSITKPIVVQPTPIASFSPVPQCPGTAFSFNDQSSIAIGTISNWSWNFGDGSGLSALVNPSHLFAGSASYNVTLTVTGSNGCIDDTTIQITPLPTPVASFTAPTVCSNESVPFTNTSTFAQGSLTNYSWRFGDGSTSTALNPLHLYATYGVYNVTLIVTASNGCVDSITQPITVKQVPDANFTCPPKCTYDSVQFNDLTAMPGGSIVSWNWNFGDGNTSIVQNPIHYYTNPATLNYSVTLITSAANGCVDTVVKPITRLAVPVANFAPNPICNDAPASFNDQTLFPSGTITNWDWNFGDGSFATTQNPSHVFPDSSLYLVTLIVTGNNGCVDTISKNYQNLTPPIPVFSFAGTCANIPFTFTDNSFQPNASIINWLWNFGDGSANSSLQNPTHLYANGGVYNVTLYITGLNGCVDSLTQPVNVLPVPVADFVSPPTCTNADVLFNDLSSLPGVGITNWLWDFGDGNSSAVQNPVHFYSNASITNYNVTLITTAANGCMDTIIKPITRLAVPVANFAPNPICNDAPASFNDQTLFPSGTITNWDWNFGDGSFATTQNPSHVFPDSSLYLVTLIVTGNNGCVDTISKNYQNLTPPIPVFSFAGTCANIPFTFTDNSFQPNASIINWLWNFGDGSANSSLQNPTHLYANGGVYNVTLYITGLNGCVDSLTQPVNVLPVPVADFVSPPTCTNADVLFNDLSSLPGVGITNWLWDFGDGNSSAVQNPVHFYSNASITNYNVTLITTAANGCMDTIIKPITRLEVPVADFAPNPICNDAPASFNDQTLFPSGTITNWDWNFGDGSFATTQNPSHVFPDSSLYLVTLIVTGNNGCVDTISKNYQNLTPPIPVFSFAGTCANIPFTFTDNSFQPNASIINWLWNFGDGSANSSLQNPTHLFASGGVYNVTLFITGLNGCVDSLTQPVNVLPVPVADFVSPPTCTNADVLFNDLSSLPGVGITNWLWDFGDGNSSAVQNPVHFYSNASITNYNVTLITTAANGCMDTIIKPITRLEVPVADFAPNPICNDAPASFNDQTLFPSGTITNWDWNFGDGSFATTQNPSHVFPDSSLYLVTLIVTGNNGCVDTISKNYQNLTPPIPVFSFAGTCANIPFTFTDNSFQPNASIINWLWNFGDGSANSSLQNPTHLFASGGVYNVTLFITGLNGCVDSLTQPVNVLPVPVADFVSPPTCTNADVLFNDLSSLPGVGITNWLWDFGDGNSSAVQNPVHFYSNASITNYNVTLITTAANGCMDTIIKPITRLEVPVADFAPNPICNDAPASFNDQTLFPSGTITNWDWNFGDGSFATTQNPSHVFPDSSLYLVTLIVTGNNGCVDTISKNYQNLMAPVPVFSFAGTCANMPFTFTDNSFQPNGSIANYIWNYGDGTLNDTVKNTTHKFATDGNFNVTLYVTGANGCVDSLTQVVNVLAVPVANFSSPNACTNANVFFNDLTALPNVGIISWNWNFGDGASSTLQNPIHFYSNPATLNYNVTLISTAANGCVDTVVKPITRLEVPVADFNVSPICNDHPADFIDATLFPSGNLSNWNWNFGDSTTAAIQNPSHVFPDSSLYLVTLIVTGNNGCIDTTAKSYQNLTAPVPVFSFAGTCANMPFTFTDNSFQPNGSIANYIWNYGDGTLNDTVKNTTHKFATDGNYNVTLYVTGANGCVDSLTQVVNVLAVPVANFSSPNACTNANVFFNDLTALPNVGIISWNWNFGDGASSTLQNPIHFYSNPATLNYNVTLISTAANGCVDTVVKPITRLEVPVADFNVSPICNDHPADFIDATLFPSGNLSNWNWNFGDSTTAAIQNPSHVFPDSSLYLVTLIVTGNNGCIDTTAKSYQNLTAPVPVFSFAGTCANMPFTFTDNSFQPNGSIANYIWNYGDGTLNDTVKNTTHKFATDGNYNVTLYVTGANGCVDSLTQVVNVLAVPVANFSSPNACTNANVFFNDLTALPNVGIISWNWNFGDGSSSTLQNPVHFYSNPATLNYNVTLISTAAYGCVDTVVKPITLFAVPVASFVDSTACLHKPSFFINQSNIMQGSITALIWHFGDSTQFTNNSSTIHTYQYPGIYNVMMIAVSNYGCFDTAYATAQVYHLPVPLFIADPLEGCEPLQVSFTNQSTCIDGHITNWLWDFGDGIYDSIQTPGHLYTNAGYYTVQLSATSSLGCESTFKRPNYIKVHPNPVADFIYEPEHPTIFNPTIQIIDKSVGANLWYYNFGDGDSSFNQTPMHTYKDWGAYIIEQVVMTQYGCTDTAFRRIEIDSAFTIYIPNAFTPNADGINESFMCSGIGIKGLTMMIFDRWGTLVYTGHSLEEPWNGTFAGKPAVMDAYAYVFNVTDIFNRNHVFRGVVRLVR